MANMVFLCKDGEAEYRFGSLFVVNVRLGRIHPVAEVFENTRIILGEFDYALNGFLEGSGTYALEDAGMYSESSLWDFILALAWANDNGEALSIHGSGQKNCQLFGSSIHNEEGLLEEQLQTSSYFS